MLWRCTDTFTCATRLQALPLRPRDSQNFETIVLLGLVLAVRYALFVCYLDRFDLMAARRRRNLLSSRRRVEDEEEDGSPVARDDNSDSQSDSSDLSDEDRDAVYAASGVRQSASATMEHLSTKLLEQVFTTPVDGAPDTEVQRSGPTSKPSFPTTADTDVMMNGLKLSDDSQAGDAIEFDEHGSETTTLMETPVNTSTAISRRPKASKEGDSTAPIFQARDRVTESATSAQASVGAPFVPNRGGFFMHDHRNEQHPRAVATARGRGRGRTTLSPRIAGSRYGFLPVQSGNSANKRFTVVLILSARGMVRSGTTICTNKLSPSRASCDTTGQPVVHGFHKLSTIRSVSCVKVRYQAPFRSVPYLLRSACLAWPTA